MRYRVGRSTYVIVVRGEPKGEDGHRVVESITLDGRRLGSGDRLPITDDGEIHDVLVVLR